MDQSSRSGKKALVIGCGIAGPVLAISLQRAGIVPVIFEGRSEPSDEAGAFLNLPPNGLAVLDTLGIKADIDAIGTPTTRLAFLNHRGKRLGQNAETTLLVKRGVLTKALREAALRRGIAVEFGKRLTDVEVTPRRTVIARFEDGSEAEGDVLVGCDGIHSRTRRAIMPAAPAPVYTGIIDSGAFTRAPAVPPSDGTMRMTFGLRGFFGYQSVGTSRCRRGKSTGSKTLPSRPRPTGIDWKPSRTSSGGSACSTGTGTITNRSRRSSAPPRARLGAGRSTTCRRYPSGTRDRFA